MVSIVIPYYNGEAFIEDTLNSCIHQTYPHIEIIVVDDMSPKEIPESIVEKYSKYPVRFVKNMQNIRFCPTANRGINLAAGEYVIVLGQDDMLLENHVETMLKEFTSDVGAVYCGYHLIDENGVDYATHKNLPERELCMTDLFHHSIHTCGLMIRKSTFWGVGGYPEQFGNFGEWELWIKILERSKIVFCKDTYGLYRRHKNNLTNDFGNLEIYKKVYQFHKRCKKLALRKGEYKLLEKFALQIHYVKWSLKRKIAILAKRTGIFDLLKKFAHK